MLRNLIPHLWLLILLNACDERNSAKSNPSTDSKAILIDSKELIVKPFVDSNFKLQLIPMEIVDSTKTDPLEKYGYHFSGNCYNCDLAELFIHEGKIRLVNVCDNKKYDELEIIKLAINEMQISATTSNVTFILKRITDTPVYQLNIEGKPGTMDHLKLVQFYTSEKALPGFKVHDCGGFEG